MKTSSLLHFIKTLVIASMLYLNALIVNPSHSETLASGLEFLMSSRILMLKWITLNKVTTLFSSRSAQIISGFSVSFKTATAIRYLIGTFVCSIMFLRTSNRRSRLLSWVFGAKIFCKMVDKVASLSRSG